MKKVILIITLAIYCISCSKNDTISNDADENNNDVFKFESIHFSIEDGDGITTDTIPLHQATYTNNTSEKGTYLFHPVLREYSLFKNDSASFSDLIKDSVAVSIPSDIFSSDNFFLSNNTVLLCDTLTSQPAPYIAEDSVFVQAHTEMTFKASQINKAVTATYYAVFKDSASGAEKIIRGKWEGIIPFSIQKEINFKPLK
ncbi:hypothetical protein A9P82_05050 [Arachidicoccus ginsenosidimutans]|uniref:hypothetical protein n=1 Tax=Arachidicoccus sp. BS20 TaxID=1850526 RepID=UPI0007F08796|nr:hypothetical protein [Arachidicoccus sp. BS20]ANI88708.1 hypothetical protein A9P82_05050 [Arachidicoccus sp. BS20]